MLSSCKTISFFSLRDLKMLSKLFEFLANAACYLASEAGPFLGNPWHSDFVTLWPDSRPGVFTVLECDVAHHIE